MTFSLSRTQLGSLFAIGAAFLFSSKAIFIKQAYALSPLVDATLLMAIRMACALPFFLLMSWLNRHHNRNLSVKDWSLLMVAGLMGYYFASWLDFQGLMYISASLERIILFLYPTLTVLASCALYRQKLSLKSIFAILLSYGGTVLVMLQEQQNAPVQEHFWLGASFVFASAIAFAAYLLLTPPLIKKFGSWNFTGLALSTACIGTLVQFFWVTPAPFELIQQLPTGVLWYGLALGFFVTVVPTVLLMQSIERLGAAQSAMIASIGPILTILLAVAFLNEHLNFWQWVGCLLNIVGVMLITLSKKKLAN
jgi:drug/metabolite transporter (DMT)-like permease